MATFSRGVRYELKQLSTRQPNDGSFRTVLTCPTNSNYYIFINMIRQYNGTGLRKAFLGIGTATGNLDTTYYKTLSSPIVITYNDEPTFVPYDLWHPSLSTDNSVSTQNDVTHLEDMAGRLLVPGEYIQSATNNPTHRLIIYYTEVYFGGQSDY